MDRGGGDEFARVADVIEAIPAQRQGVLNREAKATLQTLRTVSQAVRLDELKNGVLPASGVLGNNPPDHELELFDPVLNPGGKGALKPRLYAPWYQYRINTGPANPLVCACRPIACNADCVTVDAGVNRMISLQVFQGVAPNFVRSVDGNVTDSGGFLGVNS